MYIEMNRNIDKKASTHIYRMGQRQSSLRNKLKLSPAGPHQNAHGGGHTQLNCRLHAAPHQSLNVLQKVHVHLEQQLVMDLQNQPGAHMSPHGWCPRETLLLVFETNVETIEGCNVNAPIITPVCTLQESQFYRYSKSLLGTPNHIVCLTTPQWKTWWVLINPLVHGKTTNTKNHIILSVSVMLAPNPQIIPARAAQQKKS